MSFQALLFAVVVCGVAGTDGQLKYPLLEGRGYHGAPLALYRGFLHALRDVLFPDFRSTAGRESSASNLGSGYEGEEAGARDARLAWRAAFLARADAWGVPEYHAAHPDVVRYTVALGAAAVLYALLALLRAATGVCAAWTMRRLLALTGSELFADDGPGAASSAGVPEGSLFYRAHRDRAREEAALGGGKKAR
jgi:hypothetical protein